jgi:poly-gamma-glutamate synthase PgsB/CapB
LIALIPILFPLILLTLGAYEKNKNKKNVNKLKIRVNVNGTRGKSTATRMITSILQEAGYATAGKTTGTNARYITPITGLEREIKRKPEGPNIKEQMKTIRYAVKDGADALVCECMAVDQNIRIYIKITCLWPM